MEVIRGDGRDALAGEDMPQKVNRTRDPVAKDKFGMPNASSMTTTIPTTSTCGDTPTTRGSAVYEAVGHRDLSDHAYPRPITWARTG